MKAIEIEIHRHLFASIAEEMGAALMRSAFSPNIKERRDYSCAIFDADGEMVAQAAHIPVHLGSAPLSVLAAIEAFPALEPGQHVLLNDPYAGGTHLPDLTLVTPVHDEGGVIRFYVANRAHHADVGGISPGSLPLSRHIDDEGVRITPTLWSEELMARVLDASRTPEERRGDLLAQIAANHRGQQRLGALLARRPESLLEAASALQDYAERRIRALIASLPDGTWSFEDAIEDDGHGHTELFIRCQMTIAGEQLTFDLRDAHPQVEGPVNVPRAVTLSAALYVMQCLAPSDIPSNGGVMRPLEVLTSPGTLVDAVYPAAVAAGNVETSQRITDVLIGALSKAVPNLAPAASAGTMNNLLVGGQDTRGVVAKPFAYYETIGGGSGASDGHHGASAIQTHMTNTLNTPIEALEHAYPMTMVRYRVRRGSGGAGKWRGGDGVERGYRADVPMTVTLMTERRATRPYGLAGGEDGAAGENVLLRENHSEVALPAKHTLELEVGDTVLLRTPGGGGFGAPE